MGFESMQSAPKRWRKPNGYQYLAEVIAGTPFQEAVSRSPREAPAGRVAAHLATPSTTGGTSAERLMNRETDPHRQGATPRTGAYLLGILMVFIAVIGIVWVLLRTDVATREPRSTAALQLESAMSREVPSIPPSIPVETVELTTGTALQGPDLDQGTVIIRLPDCGFDTVEGLVLTAREDGNDSHTISKGISPFEPAVIEGVDGPRLHWAVRLKWHDVVKGTLQLPEGKKDVTIPRSALCFVTGSLVDDEGALIEGAVIQMSGPSAGIVASAESDVEGRFAIGPLPPDIDYSMSVTSDGYQMLRFRRIVFQPGETEKDCSCVLHKGSEIQGTVLLPDGEPAPNLTVCVSAPGMTDKATTSDEGSFAFATVPPPEARLWVQTDDLVTPVLAVPTGGAVGDVLPVTLQLAEGAYFEGHAYFADGRPYEQSLVFRAYPESTAGEEPGQLTKRQVLAKEILVQSDGSFRIGPFPKDEPIIVEEPTQPGCEGVYRLTERPTFEFAKHVVVNIRLNVSMSSGMASDLTGVLYVVAEDSVQGPMHFTTDAKGSFYFRARILPASETTIRVNVDGFKSSSRQLAERDGEYTVDVALDPSSPLELSVGSASEMAPERIDVDISWPRSNSDLFSPLRYYTTVSDGAGFASRNGTRFKDIPDGRLQFDDDIPASLDITATADGFYPWNVQLPVPRGRYLDVLLEPVPEIDL